MSKDIVANKIDVPLLSDSLSVTLSVSTLLNNYCALIWGKYVTKKLDLVPHSNDSNVLLINNNMTVSVGLGNVSFGGFNRKLNF